MKLENMYRVTVYKFLLEYLDNIQLPFPNSDSEGNMHLSQKKFSYILEFFCIILNNLEANLNSDTYYFMMLFDQNMIESKEYLARINLDLGEDLSKSIFKLSEIRNKKPNSNSNVVREIINISTSLSEKMVPNLLTSPLDLNHHTGRSVFLSYSFDDRLYSLGLYFLCQMNGIKLYVDWLHNDKIERGEQLKRILNNAQENCDTLLFLRTASSELGTRGNHNIKQWCAWEIGNFYNNHKDTRFDRKVYIDMYDSKKANNKLLDDFKLINNISEL